MKNLLLITSRNVINTSGELRLIKNRTESLLLKYGIRTDILAICNEKKLNNPREVIEGTDIFHIETFKKRNILTILIAIYKLRKTLKSLLKKKNYNAIVVSGPLVFSFIKFIKQRINPQLPIVADMHGSLEELIEFNNGIILSKTLKQIIYRSAKNTEAKELPFVDAVFTVSKSLKYYLIDEYNLQDKNFYIIPCATNKFKIDIKKNQEFRNYYRNKYGFKNEIVFIYSGGVSAWQCIDETIDLYKKVRKNIDGKTKLLILSHDINKLNYLKEDNDIILDKIPSEDVANVLCAGDFAFLLRNDFVTNNVAFPNKFLEYVRSGMRIIATQYVYDVVEYIEKYDLGYILDNNEEELFLFINDYHKNRYENNFSQREKLLNLLSFDNTTKPFVEDYFK